MATDAITQSVLNKTRKDKYLLVLNLPKVLKDYDNHKMNVRAQNLLRLDALQYSVYGSPVPAVSVPAVELPTYGQTYKVTSQTRSAYPPISVNFTIDNRFDNYWVLWKWLDVMNKIKTSGMDSEFAVYEEGDPESNGIQRARTGANNITKALLQKHNEDTSNADNLKFDQIKMKNNYLDYQTLITIYGLDEYNEKIIKFDYFNAFITDLGDIAYSYRDPAEAECTFQFAFSQMDITLIDGCD